MTAKVTQTSITKTIGLSYNYRCEGLVRMAKESSFSKCVYYLLLLEYYSKKLGPAAYKFFSY